MRLLKRGFDIWKTEGTKEFRKQSLMYNSRRIGYIYFRTIRKYLPTTGYIHTNSVRMDEKVMLDEFLPDHWPGQRTGNNDGKEGLVRPHRELTSEGDRVTIIGGGAGISPVVAGRQVGKTGKVTVHEAAEEYYDECSRIIAINDIEDVVTVQHSIVGPGIDIFGDGSDAAHVPVDSLSPCDVLEMDCEGAEEEILRNITIRPRILIVEIHPDKISCNPEWVLQRISELDYEIVLRLAPHGTEMADDELRTKLSKGEKQDIEPQTGRRAMITCVKN